MKAGRTKVLKSLSERTMDRKLLRGETLGKRRTLGGKDTTRSAEDLLTRNSSFQREGVPGASGIAPGGHLLAALLDDAYSTCRVSR
jgi:hypothetical protein